MAGAGDRDVEQPTLLLGILGEAMRKLVGLCVVHDDIRPFLPLDPMHRGERDPGVGPRGLQVAAQPGFEGVRIRVQLGQLHDRGEIVALSGTVHAASVVVERRDRRGEADGVTYCAQQLCRGGSRRSHGLQSLDVAREGKHPLCFAFDGESLGQSAQAIDGGLFGHPFADVGMQGS